MGSLEDDEAVDEFWLLSLLLPVCPFRLLVVEERGGVTREGDRDDGPKEPPEGTFEPGN